MSGVPSYGPAAAGIRGHPVVAAVGFRTWWFNSSRDFDGVFEWSARATRPKMGATLRPLAQRANFGIWLGQETVFVVNDNSGR
jgi:hypothetical protein